MVQSLLNTFERDLIAMGEDSEKQPVQDLEAKMEQQNKKNGKKLNHYWPNQLFVSNYAMIS